MFLKLEVAEERQTVVQYGGATEGPKGQGQATSWVDFELIV